MIEARSYIFIEKYLEAKIKIFVGYDGSSVAKAALELARQHATTWNAKIEVVNCMHQNQKLKYEDIRKVEQNLEDEVYAIINSGADPYQGYVSISDLESGEDLVQFAEEN
jgi:hypothetical protein